MDTIKDNLIFTNLSSNDTIQIPSLTSGYLSLSFRFWFLLILTISSLICYFLVLIFILTEKTQRQALHNHSTLVLLFISLAIILFDYTLVMNSYLHDGTVRPATAAFCLFWMLVDISFFQSCTVILAWASFERHILIFHSTWISTKRKRIYIHYLPLILILIYLTIFYTYVFFFAPCENQYDFTTPGCGDHPCYLTIPLLGFWDSVIHGIIPTFLIALFNIALLARILWQKRRRLEWEKYQKMAFQLFSISSLYLSLNFPLMIINVVQSLGSPDWAIQVEVYIFFFTVLIQYLLPFVCLTYVPDKWLKLTKFFARIRQRFMSVVNIRSAPVP